MQQSTRLIVNFLATLSRMVINIGIGLLVTRLLLQTMGRSDFGLIMALGATISLFTILTATMRASISRRLGLAVGRGNTNAIEISFNTAFALFLLMGGLVLALGLGFSGVVLSGLEIPLEREGSARLLYNLTLLTFVATIVFLPFEDMLIARQEIIITSVFEVALALLRLAIAISLVYENDDALLQYAWLLLIAQFLLGIARVVVCQAKIPVSRIRLSQATIFEAREIFAFSRWTMLHSASNWLQRDGNMILVNLAFGTAMNAVYAVAKQMSQYVVNFSLAIERVVMPASLNSQGRGDDAMSTRIALVGERYSILALSLLAVPIVIEAPFLIELWLGSDSYTPMMALFGRLLIIETLLGISSRSIAVRAFGTGNYAGYSIMQFVVVAIGFMLVAVWFLVVDLPVWSLPVTLLCSALVLNVVRIFYVGGKVGIKPMQWVKSVLNPLLLSTTVATLAAVCVSHSLEESLLRVLLSTLSFAILALPCIWYFGVEEQEKHHFLRLINRLRLGNNAN